MKRSFSRFTFLILMTSMTFVAMSANATETGGAGSGGGGDGISPSECIIIAVSKINHASEQLNLLPSILNCHPSPEQAVCTLGALTKMQDYSDKDVLNHSINGCFPKDARTTKF